MRQLTKQLTFGWKMSQNKYPLPRVRLRLATKLTALPNVPYYSTQTLMAIPGGFQRMERLFWATWVENTLLHLAPL
jgi:hypothetical protein